MPAKPLSPEQRAEADALRRRYNNFTSDLRIAGKPWTQEAIAAQLGFTQSNLNQYLGGKIPLGPDAVLSFARFFGVSPRDISPIVTKDTVARAKEWLIAAGEAAAYWPFEAVKFERWDRLRERQKGEIEKAMNLALDEIEFGGTLGKRRSGMILPFRAYAQRDSSVTREGRRSPDVGFGQVIPFFAD